MPYRRDYLCPQCGKLRRAEVPRAARPHRLELGSGMAERVPTPGEIEAFVPACCGDPMRLLRYEESVAAKQLGAAKRIDWFRAGAHYGRRGGKRQWKPVMDSSRCHGCRHGKES